MVRAGQNLVVRDAALRLLLHQCQFSCLPGSLQPSTLNRLQSREGVRTYIDNPKSILENQSSLFTPSEIITAIFFFFLKPGLWNFSGLGQLVGLTCVDTWGVFKSVKISDRDCRLYVPWSITWLNCEKNRISTFLLKLPTLVSKGDFVIIGNSYKINKISQ